MLTSFSSNRLQLVVCLLASGLESLKPALSIFHSLNRYVLLQKKVVAPPFKMVVPSLNIPHFLFGRLQFIVNLSELVFELPCLPIESPLFDDEILELIAENALVRFRRSQLFPVAIEEACLRCGLF